MRQLLAGFVVAMLWCGTAGAAGVAGVRCEDPKVIEFIKTNLKGMKSEYGDSLARFLGNNSKLTATTVSAQSKGFVCQIKLNLTYAGNSDSIRGRFVYREFGTGKASVKFIPF